MSFGISANRECSPMTKHLISGISEIGTDKIALKELNISFSLQFRSIAETFIFMAKKDSKFTLIFVWRFCEIGLFPVDVSINDSGLI